MVEIRIPREMPTFVPPSFEVALGPYGMHQQIVIAQGPDYLLKHAAEFARFGEDCYTKEDVRTCLERYASRDNPTNILIDAYRTDAEVILGAAIAFMEAEPLSHLTLFVRVSESSAYAVYRDVLQKLTERYRILGTTTESDQGATQSSGLTRWLRRTLTSEGRAIARESPAVRSLVENLGDAKNPREEKGILDKLFVLSLRSPGAFEIDTIQRLIAMGASLKDYSQFFGIFYSLARARGPSTALAAGFISQKEEEELKFVSGQLNNAIRTKMEDDQKTRIEIASNIQRNFIPDEIPFDVNETVTGSYRNLFGKKGDLRVGAIEIDGRRVIVSFQSGFAKPIFNSSEKWGSIYEICMRAVNEQDAKQILHAIFTLFDTVFKPNEKYERGSDGFKVEYYSDGSEVEYYGDETLPAEFGGQLALRIRIEYGERRMDRANFLLKVLKENFGLVMGRLWTAQTALDTDVGGVTQGHWWEKWWMSEEEDSLRQTKRDISSNIEKSFVPDEASLDVHETVADGYQNLFGKEGDFRAGLITVGQRKLVVTFEQDRAVDKTEETTYRIHLRALNERDAEHVLLPIYVEYVSAAGFKKGNHYVWHRVKERLSFSGGRAETGDYDLHSHHLPGDIYRSDEYPLNHAPPIDLGGPFALYMYFHRGREESRNARTLFWVLKEKFGLVMGHLRTEQSDSIATPSRGTSGDVAHRHAARARGRGLGRRAASMIHRGGAVFAGARAVRRVV